METLLQDLRYGLRMLLKSPAFTTIAILTLALGIGANTAIFTIVNALLLKMLPIKAPQELVVVGDPAMVDYRWHGTPGTEVVSYPLYREFRDQATVFTGLVAASSEDVEVDADSTNGAPAERVASRLVSGNYFPVLGVDAAAGRLLTENDDTQDNANPVVVLSYGYWKTRFALSPAIIGKEIRLNGYPFTVVGVTQRKFAGDVVEQEFPLFVPLSMQPEMWREKSVRNDPKVSWLSLIGRLKPGVSSAQAKANVNLVFQRALKGQYGATLSQDDLQEIGSAQIKVVPGGAGLSEFREEYGTPLLLLMGIVGLVLLIACVNVANLMLARATARSKEVAVRLAIGASPARLLRQLLTESILLALLGGICGALLSIWGVRILVTLFGSDTESLPLSPDIRVLSFALAVCLFTGILFGIAPALKAIRVEVNPTLKDVAAPEARSRFGWGKGLVAGQVALSLLVLFGAGLLVRSLQNLMTQDFGYDSSRIVVAHLGASDAGYRGERKKQLAQELATRMSALPRVRGVTYSGLGFFSGGESSDAIVVPGFNPEKREERSARRDSVGPGYFDLVGMPILSGRGIGAQDTASSTRVAVVNQAMVKHFFHGENPIGRQFHIDEPGKGEITQPLTVIGVSRDAKDHSEFLRKAPLPRFYRAYQQDPEAQNFVLEVVADGDPKTVLGEVRSQIKAFDPKLPIYSIQTVRRRIENSLSSQIALAKLTAFFAGLALLLACIGLYGLMSYAVASRTREIGVRIALGAQRGDMLRLVLREGMLLVGVGLAIGIPLSLASSRILQSFLFGLKNTDPLSMMTVTLLLGIVAVAAALIPARRATKVDPIIALRYE
jgi:predicted permease